MSNAMCDQPKRSLRLLRIFVGYLGIGDSGLLMLGRLVSQE